MKTLVKSLLIAVAAVFLLVVVVGGVWWHRFTQTPTLAIPNPVMPVPNALDSYVAAGKQLHYSQDLLAAQQPSQIVQENAKALALVRRGLALPYLSPPARSINDTFPYWKTERDLARLLVLEGQVEASKGNLGAAVNSDLDAVQMGKQIPHGAALMGSLVGIACQFIGRAAIWPQINQLSAPQALAAERRLARLQTLDTSAAEALQQEEWFGHSAIMSDMRRGGTFAPLPWYMRNIFVNRYDQYMNELIANARLPYAQKPPDPPMPHDIVNAIYDPVFSGMEWKITDNHAQDGLLLAALALRAYHVTQGGYPASLQALVPKYLAHVPNDPFAASSKPLRYRRQPGAYLLYSIGPDGKDNGGTPIRQRFIYDKSRGDIVAGVNQ